MTLTRRPEIVEVDLRVIIRRIVVRTAHVVAPESASRDEATGSLLQATRTAATRSR